MHTLKNKNIDITELEEKLLHHLLDDYISYYNYVSNNLSADEIILFENLIKEPETTMQRINKVLPKDRQLSNEVLETEVLRLKAQPFGAKDTFGASLPNAEKEIAKNAIKKELKILPNYNLANQIYSKILSK